MAIRASRGSALRAICYFFSLPYNWLAHQYDWRFYWYPHIAVTHILDRRKSYW